MFAQLMGERERIGVSFQVRLHAMFFDCNLEFMQVEDTYISIRTSEESLTMMGLM